MSYVLALLVLLLPVVSASAAEIRPADGAELTQIHLEFRWEAACFARGYQLAVVPDDASPDPFAATAPVADALVGGFQPRAVITSGLAFGQRYAWRVRSRQSRHPRSRRWNRGAEPTYGPWGPTRRFEVAPLPDNLPPLSVSEPEHHGWNQRGHHRPGRGREGHLHLHQRSS